MGNSPSHAPAPLDGYMAVRASIEARLSQPTTMPQAAPLPAGCCDAYGGRKMSAAREHQHRKCSRESGRFSTSAFPETRGTGALPPTLSIAETTDTNSDGAPDEFEAAAAAEEMLGGLSQSFTRVRAPHVRAQSPLPFPSMASCSPTVSKRSKPQQLLRNSSSSDEGDPPAKPSKASAARTSRQCDSKPQQLTAMTSAGNRQPAKQHANERSNSHGVTNGATGVHMKDSDMFCPLSPNSALSFATSPLAPAAKSGQQTAIQGIAPQGFPAQGSPKMDSVSYGPMCNHSPFLEGRALQTLLPLLFGPSLGTCMGVCVHWFMKISDGLAALCSPLARDFEASYGKYFSPTSANLKLQPLQTADGNGTRVDWVITAKVLDPASGSVLSLGYCFEYRSQPSSQCSPSALTDCRGRELSGDFSSRWADGGPSSRRSALRGRQGEGTHAPAIVWPPGRAGGPCAGRSRREVPMFSVAVAPAGSKRRMWLHRDLCRFHGDETGQAVLTPLGPVCVGDLIELPIVLANGIGLADLSTVRWLPLNRAPRVPRVLAGPKAFEAASLGVYEGCGLEMQYVEWFDGDQYRHMTTERLKRAECMEPELQHLSTSYSGIDVLVRRSVYSAARAGSVGATAQRAWGLQCQVLPADSPVVFPLTRRGLLHDRSTCLQLREGDILEAYLTIGGANF